MTATVMTVLGPVAPEALDVSDAQTHAWIEPVAGGDPDAPQLSDLPLQGAGLKAYVAAGGRTIVDCQPGACGRDGNRLTQLSHQTGVQIVACIGFQLRRYYGPYALFWTLSAKLACDCLLAEVRRGLTETRSRDRPVRPGFVKIAAEAALATSPRHLSEVAAHASFSTGYAIQIHTECGADVEAVLSFFRDPRVPADRMVFCHVDERPDFGPHCELVEERALLEYDTFVRPKYAPEKQVWPLNDRMLGAGLSNGMALATDIADRSTWDAIGAVGFITSNQAPLAARGVPPEAIAQLVGGNIARRLATSTSSKEHV
jgi:predicted metal-dependent phosphotriesterase family hydrolase